MLQCAQVTKKSSHGISVNLKTETEIKVEKNLRLETETETLEMPETRPRRDSRVVSVRETVKSESPADPWTAGFFLQFLGFSISLKTGLYELGNSKSITKIKSNNKLDKCAHILSLGTVGSGGCDKILATFSLFDKIC